MKLNDSPVLLAGRYVPRYPSVKGGKVDLIFCLLVCGLRVPKIGDVVESIIITMTPRRGKLHLIADAIWKHTHVDLFFAHVPTPVSFVLSIKTTPV